MSKENISSLDITMVSSTMTDEQFQANKSIRLRGLVSSFVEKLQEFRPKASRALFYRAFAPNEPETELLAIVRNMAVDFINDLQPKQNVHGIIMAAAPQMSGAVMSSHA